MIEQWYYAKDGQQSGPVAAGELKRLASDGRLRPVDLVWKDGMTGWVQASSVKGLFPAPISLPPQTASAAPLPPQSAAVQDAGGASYTMKGVSQELVVYADKLTVTPKGVLGFLVKGVKGTKTIPFYSISAMQFKEAGPMFNGYLQFSIPGGNESKGGIFTAGADENTFMFAGRDNNATVHAIKEYIESAIRKLRGSASNSASVSVSDELQKLAKLKDQGVLTDEEFQSAKRKLIG